MSHHSWYQNVQAAIPDDELCARIWYAGCREPNQLPKLFDDIAQHILSSKAQETSQNLPTNSKKRKFEDGVSSEIPPSVSTLALSCKDVSFQAPVRKKLKLEIVADAADPTARGIKILQPGTNEIELWLSAQHIDQVFCLPMPEKQARQQNFVVFPKSTSTSGQSVEQVLFVMNETKPGVDFAAEALQEDDTYVTATTRALRKLLDSERKRVIVPTEAEFASSIPQSHRKGEKAYHVKAHRAAKEGN